MRRPAKISRRKSKRMFGRTVRKSHRKNRGTTQRGGVAL